MIIPAKLAAATKAATAATAATAAATATALALLAAASPGVALAQQAADPALQQSVSASERVAPAGEAVTIDAGHVDVGPVLIDGQLQLLARDDTQVEPVWRHLNDITFLVTETTTLPEGTGDDYAFVGADEGDELWVIPQTESPNNPWLGWNTQSPTVLDAGMTGATLELAGFDGAGEHSLFLQNGGFAPPDVLWTNEDPRPVWVEPNTHTHANWTFNQPGEHSLNLRATVTFADGTSQAAEDTMHFRIGDENSVSAVNAATSATSSDRRDLMMWLLIGVLIVAVLAVFGVLGVKVLRGRAEDRAEEDRK